MKYSSGKVYFSVLALSSASATRTASETVTSANTPRFVIQSNVVERGSEVTERLGARFHIFKSVFGDIDGSTASFSDRANMRLDDPSMSFGETDFLSFQKLLEVAGCKDGQVLFDLGCGAGKVLVAAILSNVKFMRCTGIELLPTLCALSQQAIDRVRAMVGGPFLGSGSVMFEDVKDKTLKDAVGLGVFATSSTAGVPFVPPLTTVMYVYL